MADSDEKLKPTKADAAHAFVRGALSTVPLAGGPAAELFSALVAAPLARRRDRWIKEIGEAVEELKEKIEGLTLENLSQNEEFISTLLHATQIASRSHQEEKLKALRNAITNAALPDPPDDLTQQLFLNYVDSLTPWHLKALAYLDDPAKWAAKRGASLPNHPVTNPADYVFVLVFPELRERPYLFTRLCRDLEARGLIEIMEKPPATNRYLLTSMGVSFLRFVSSPF